jgi:hypothetical protein
MKILFAAIAFSLAGVALGQEKPVPLRAVHDGVYFYNSGYQRRILEIKGGHFRFWYSSDSTFGKPPEYPITGAYTNEGGTISFEHKFGTVEFSGDVRKKIESVRTERWEFMRYQGKVTLWNAGALTQLQQKVHPVFLSQSDKKPEDIWSARK